MGGILVKKGLPPPFLGKGKCNIKLSESLTQQREALLEAAKSSIARSRLDLTQLGLGLGVMW